MTISPNLAILNIATLDLIVLALILAGLCFWLVSKLSEARLKKTLQKESDESLFASPYRCVLFSPCSHACKIAQAYPTKPLLISNAPSLPLQGCEEAKCECSLLQYDDRRTGKDRRDLELIEKNRKSVYANKRLLKDRRRDSIREFLLPQYRSFS